MLALRQSSFAVRPSHALFATGVVLLFMVSPLSLSMMGIAYDAPGGNALHKLHPSTLFLCLAALAHLLQQRDPIAAIATLPERLPGAAIFLGAWATLASFIAFWLKTPLMPIIDTFIPAIAALVVLQDDDESLQRRLTLFIHAVLAANAIIAILEFATGMRLTPFVVGGVEVPHDVRSTALLGHPLNNAAIAATYALALTFGGDRTLPPGLRLALVGLQLTALVPFGGRTAMVATYLVVSIAMLGRSFLALAREETRSGHWIAVAIGAPLVLAAAGGVIASGAIDKILERFVNDAGSAQARVAMFDLFDHLSLQDLLFAPSPDHLMSLQRSLGIEYGIENSWLGILLQYGFVAGSIFIIGIFFLLRDVMARCGWSAAPALALMLVAVSSAASLSVKSVQLTQWSVVVLALFARPDGKEAA